MARCPFADWLPISGSCGPFSGGPYKIVHHTTEGFTAAAEFDAFRVHRSDPHFTVDAAKIVQHIDTDGSARALQNLAGGVETNRDSAVQIEVVGFAGAAKNKITLKNVARLCRWIEATHQVARVWPSGPPKPAVHGGDPGGHNRNPATWDNGSGHFGHCHVPENVHWDPAYTAVEADFVLAATFDEHGTISNQVDPKVAALLARPALGLDAYPPQVITDHNDVCDTDA